MRTSWPLRAAALAILALAGCSSDDSGGGTGAGGGTGGATTGTDGSGGGELACDESTFGVDAPVSEVTIHVENRLEVAIEIPNACHFEGVDGVSVDGQSMDTWGRYLCAEAEAGTCADQSMDCHSQGDIVLEAGETLTITWDGRLDSEPMPVPASCPLDACATGGLPVQCSQLLAAEPGAHTVEVVYRLVEGTGSGASATAEIDFPTDSVTVVIGP